MIETTSKLMMWWLSTFRGYEVKAVARTPRVAPFGRIVYDSRYELVRN